MFKNKLEFITMDAPHVVPKGSQNETGDDCNRGWWFSSCDQGVNFFSSRQSTDSDEGFRKSLDAIDEKIRIDGPFDGILGFSQGGALAAMVVASNKYDFKFAVLIASFKSMSSAHEKFYTSKVTIPSLHIIGGTDNVVLKDVSEQLLDHFLNPVVLYHPGGHCIPSSSILKAEVTKFISEFHDSKS